MNSPLRITKSKVRNLLPSRTKASNKNDGGKVLVVGGGKGLYGAGILTALAATRSGAGYTHLMTDLTLFPWLKFPDFILHPIKISELKNKESFVIAIGPGLGTEDKKKKLIEFLLKKKFQKVILDADALTLLSKMKVKKLPESWILTPHEGELARLLGKTSAYIKANRLSSLEAAEKKYGCTILLKGHETLITNSVKKIYSVKEGTPALAKAGTGDALLGIVAAMYAQNLAPLDAAIVGSYTHGLCSQIWNKKSYDHLSFRPIDLIELLPLSLRFIRNKAAKNS